MGKQTRALPEWWPKNPYPEAVFPMGRDRYPEIVPDPDLRTGLSGMLGREFWNIASDAIFDAMCDAMEDQGPVDLEAIEQRISGIEDWCDYEKLEWLLADAESLCGEVRRLQGELASERREHRITLRLAEEGEFSLDQEATQAERQRCLDLEEHNKELATSLTKAIHNLHEAQLTIQRVEKALVPRGN